MFSAFVNSFKIPELRKRILFTLGLILIVRIVDVVPTPGVDPVELERLIEKIESEVGGGLLGLIDLFSGGALRRCAVGSLGIMTYISASIILQLMTAVVPALERLAREGEVGRQKLTQYGRYLTIGICLVQGLAMAYALENPGSLGLPGRIVTHPGWGFRLMTVLTMTTGSMLIMWLGEQMTEYGIGNGISLVITVGIVSRLPDSIYSTYAMFQKVDGVARFNLFHLVGLIVMFLLVTAGTIALTQGQRRIPIHTTRRVVGRKVYEGMNTYMPLKVNYSGVMPIIFASAILSFPIMLLSRAPNSWTVCHQVASAMSRESGIYMLFYGGMILFFSYFWVATQFNPLQIADDLKRTGGYVPGIRPGRPTADFLDKAMTRITFAGALFLTIVAVIPSIMASQFKVPWLVSSFFGGTGLLIIVGVALETMRQIESHLLMRHYDGFLRKGRRIKGRR
ncbi:MAG: preprotein translocase subunit SecY [Verrucomicrobiota bacterium]|nr:preprotein translocase subunit SecY [Verrucomicrobiota bacterium]